MKAYGEDADQATYFLQNPVIYDLIYFRKMSFENVVAQSCLTLCSPMDCRPPGSSVHGIL